MRSRRETGRNHPESAVNPDTSPARGHPIRSADPWKRQVTVEERTVRRILDSPPGFLKESFKDACVAYCRLLRARKTFTFNGCDYHYMFHPYNLTWRNERAVEIPVALSYLESHRGDRILEVGNVLSHYVATGHDILDKYEKAPGVTNEDVTAFDPGEDFDLIISVSTLEHVGWDETPREPDKAIAAIDNLVRLLAPGGELVFTAPLGLNPDFDRLLEKGALPLDDLWALERVSENNWRQAPFEAVKGAGYPKRSFRADAIVIGRAAEGGVRSL